MVLAKPNHTHLCQQTASGSCCRGRRPAHHRGRTRCARKLCLGAVVWQSADIQRRTRHNAEVLFWVSVALCKYFTHVKYTVIALLDNKVIHRTSKKVQRGLFKLAYTRWSLKYVHVHARTNKLQDRLRSTSWTRLSIY